jgi:hypothetical protein
MLLIFYEEFTLKGFLLFSIFFISSLNLSLIINFKANKIENQISPNQKIFTIKNYKTDRIINKANKTIRYFLHLILKD